MPDFLPCAAVLFDCDGVLVDSDASVSSAWTRWAGDVGLDPVVVTAAVHGRRSADTVAALLAAEAVADALALINRYEIEDAATVGALPGARDLLATMPTGTWAVVTSGTRPLAQARLRAAGLPDPLVLIAAEDVTRGKPDAEGYLAAASRLGVLPGHAVVIEDAATGMAAARAAGVAAIVGVGDRDDGGQPDERVADLRSVRWTGAGLQCR